MQSFGERLKNLRVSRGLSQEGLCNELNKKFGTVINKSMVSKWENDKEEPRIEYARKLVNFFNVSLDYLLGCTDDPNGVDGLSKKANNMPDWMSKLSPSMLEKLQNNGEFTALMRITDKLNLNDIPIESLETIIDTFIDAVKRDRKG